MQLAQQPKHRESVKEGVVLPLPQFLAMSMLSYIWV